MRAIENGNIRKACSNSVARPFLPVSYTHLDVYKRQALAGLVREDGTRPLLIAVTQLKMGIRDSA